MTRAPLLLEGPKRRASGWPWGLLVLILIPVGLWWGSQHIKEGPGPIIKAKATQAPAAPPREDVNRDAEREVRESLGTLAKHRDRISPTEEVTTLELPPSIQGNMFEPGFSKCIIYKNSEYKVVRFVCVTGVGRMVE